MLELIMCVDDDPITLMLFKKVIQKASFAKGFLCNTHYQSNTETWGFNHGNTGAEQNNSAPVLP